MERGLKFPLSQSFAKSITRLINPTFRKNLKMGIGSARLWSQLNKRHNLLAKV